MTLCRGLAQVGGFISCRPIFVAGIPCLNIGLVGVVGIGAAGDDVVESSGAALGSREGLCSGSLGVEVRQLDDKSFRNESMLMVEIVF